MTTLVPPPLVIDFDEAAHVYRVNGEVWINVTGVLERTGLVDFSQIPDGIRRAALSRGHRVHRAAHSLAEGTLDWSSVAEDEKGYVEACANFLAASQFEMAGQERRLAHPTLRYAGTCDAFGWWDGSCALVDWCTGPLFESAKEIQLSAYAEAMRHNPPPEWFDWAPTQPIARIGVHLKKTAKYHPEPYSDPRDFGKFCAALTVAQEQMRRGVRGRRAAA